MSNVVLVDGILSQTDQTSYRLSFEFLLSAVMERNRRKFCETWKFMHRSTDEGRARFRETGEEDMPSS